MTARQKILVIKLGALGDFVQAMGPAKAIRAHHPDAEITLLTNPALAELGQAAPYFDRVWTDERPGLRSLRALVRQRRRLIEAGFSRVYDLQTSDRSSLYFHLLWPAPRPEWSGIARGSSHRHRNPARDRMHTLERQAEQLRIAGIAKVPPPDLSWAAADVGRFGLGDRILLLVPGGSAHRTEKRWPAERYGALAALAAGRGFTPVVLGAAAETPLAAAIVTVCREARDLTGETRLGEIAGLGRVAQHAVGNDTGPMHLIAAAGCPTTVLYSAASDPTLTRPWGPAVAVLQRPDLAELAVGEVAAAVGLG